MLGLPTGKESACNAGFDSWVRKIPWRKKWQSTTVSLPGNPTDRGAWWATVHGVARVGHDLATKPLLRNVCQKPTQYYKIIIFQLKIKF